MNNFLNHITSKKVILIIAIIEMILCLIFILLRIERIRLFNELEESRIRALINPYDIENGWNIIFASILFLSGLLTFRFKILAWVLKQISLFSLLIFIGFTLNYIGLLCFCLIIFYSLKNTRNYFQILSTKQKKDYYLISIFVSLLLLTGAFTINLN